MKKITLVVCLLLIAGSSFAEFSKTGSAGAQFLKIGVGSRYQGMGEAAVATANDIYASYWNPAGLADVENSSVSFTNVNYLLDIDMNYAAFAHYFEDVGTFAVSASVLSLGEQEITTFEQQQGTGDFFTAASYAVGLSYARYLTNRFSFGLTSKWVGERIHNEKSSTFAFDFGTMLYTGFRSLRLGMSITNMGPELNFSGPDLDVNYDDQAGGGSNTPIGAQVKTTPYNLPTMFRVGMAYDVEFGPNSMVTVTGEMRHPNDNEQQGAFGTEFAYADKFFLRGGYRVGYDEETLAFGAGLKTSVSSTTRLVIDYAWQDFGRLESTQRFSVGFTF